MDFEDYQPKKDHRDKTAEKSQWTISEIDEIKLFLRGFCNHWYNPSKEQIWAVTKDFTIIGEESRNSKNRGSKFTSLFFAKFTSDKQNVWHGYPISPYLNHDRTIPQSIINDWLDRKIVEKSYMAKWQKGKI